MKKFRTASMIVLGVVLVGALCFVNLYAAPVVVGNFTVDYAIQSDWGSGATMNVTLKNVGPGIQGWTIGWTFPGNQTITNMWDATYTQSGASATAKNVAHNASLPTGGSVIFGFNVNYSGTNTAPTSFTVNSPITNPTSTSRPNTPTPTRRVTPTPQVTPTPTSPQDTPAPTGTPNPSATPLPTARPNTLTPTRIWYPTISPTPQPTFKYEAEDAALSGGAYIATDHTGYTGTGFVSGYGTGTGQTTTFTVNKDGYGVPLVIFRYANSGGVTQQMSIYVNGTHATDLLFPNLANWDTWANLGTVLTLKQGINTITFKKDGADGYVNLDYITVRLQ